MISEALKELILLHVSANAENKNFGMTETNSITWIQMPKFLFSATISASSEMCNEIDSFRASEITTRIYYFSIVFGSPEISSFGATEINS